MSQPKQITGLVPSDWCTIRNVAALFFFRRRLRHLLDNPDSEEMEGVRICIPLDRVDKITQRMMANTIPIISLTITAADNSEPSAAPEVGDAIAASTQVIDLAAYKANERWQEIEQLIKDSKVHRGT